VFAWWRDARWLTCCCVPFVIFLLRHQREVAESLVGKLLVLELSPHVVGSIC
jgi:hypothetical protein